jgi:protein O-mannosyl-transferase
MNTPAVLILFIIVGFLLYGASLGGDFLVWDDRYLVRDNPIVAEMSPVTVRAAFTSFDPELYVPVTFLSLQVDHLIGGSSTWIYHTTALLLHILNAFLAFLILVALGRSRIAALIAGLLFLVHPVNVEAVAWISARKDLLSTSFALASVLFYIRYCRAPRPVFYGLSVAAFALALLSKVSVLLLPAGLLLIDLLLRRQVTMRTLTEKIPYAALSVALGIVAVVAKSHVLQSSDPLATLLLAFRNIAGHLLAIAWPAWFAAVYPYAGTATLFALDIVLSIVAVTGLVAAILWSWKRTRLPAVGAAIFLLFLAPSFGTYFKFDGIFLGSDRYVYAGWIGLLLIVAWGIDTLVPRLPEVRRKSAGAIVAVVLLALGILTARQALLWQNTSTVFENVLQHYPESKLARINIAVGLREDGDATGAMAVMKQALAASPNDPKTLAVAASVEKATGQTAEARRHYQAALDIRPDMAEALFGLGTISEDEGKIDEAIGYYERAIAFDPALEGVHNNLGGLYLAQGRYVAAQREFESALDINPLLKQVHFNLGIAYQRHAMLKEARASFGNAIMIDPEYADAYANLAAVDLLENDDISARKNVDKALQIDPQHPVALQIQAMLK